MQIILELNEKYQRGFQARMLMGGLESVMDDEPYTLREIASGVAAALEEINANTGHHFELHKVIRIDAAAIEANKKYDLDAARIAKDNRGKYAYLDTNTPDYIKREDDYLLSGRGLVMICYSQWREDENPQAKAAMRRYCQYLALKGYGARASAILEEILGKDQETARTWIKGTYGAFVEDEHELISFVMGG